MYDHNFIQSKDGISFKNATLQPLLTPRDEKKELTYLITVSKMNNESFSSPIGESPYMKLGA